MARAFLMLMLAASLAVGQPPAPQPPPAEPEEEEPSLKPKEYILNPIQAENEIKVGRYYMKRSNFKGAAARFEEAAKWNPALASAYLLLGEAREKLRDPKSAKAAYEKYLQLAPDAKDAGDVKKRLAKLGGKS